MLIKYLRAFALVALSACASPAPTQTREDFVLCNQTPGNSFRIAVEYEELIGIYEDYGRDVGACGEAASGCIDFPILLSVPPRLPSRPGEEVRWTVAKYRFAIRSGSGAGNEYLIEAEKIKPNGTSLGKEFYDYDSSEGVTRYWAEGSPARWLRCGGRLTFDDLRLLRQRLESRSYPAH